MFKNKYPKRIISDEGFEIQIGGRGSITYKEGTKILNINTELLANNYIIVIYKNSISGWSSDSSKELFTDDKKEKILMNIKKALDFYKVKYEIS